MARALVTSWATLPHDRLFPRDLCIAQLAADGLTNREIGQVLSLSHRTVGSHLYLIFLKLGITSRTGALGAIELQRPAGRWSA